MRNTRRHVPLVSLLVTLLLLAASGCKKKSSDGTPEVDKAQAERLKTAQAQWAKDEAASIATIEAKLAYIQGLRGKLAPPTTKDNVTLDKDWTRDLWVYEADLADVAVEPKGPRVKDVSEIRECAKEARHPDFGKHNSTTIDKCAGIRYVYIVRTLARTEPKFLADATKIESGKFSAGVANGDVLVYDVRDKKHIGGYRWSARNDASILGPELGKNFEANIIKAIEGGYTGNLKHP